MHQTDTLLIKKVCAGNKKAAQMLYEKYESQWFLLCLRYGRNRNEAQDIFQEGATKVFQVLKQFDAKKGTFPSWSAKIIVNEALKYLKRQQKHSTHGELSELANQVDLSMDISSALSAKELIGLIQQLPAGYRMVFNLFEIEGYTHKEIAKMLQISVGTSKSQLFKAKQLLQRQMKQLF